MKDLTEKEKEVNKILERLNMKLISLDEARALIRETGIYQILSSKLDELQQTKAQLEELKEGINSLITDPKHSEFVEEGSSGDWFYRCDEFDIKVKQLLTNIK